MRAYSSSDGTYNGLCSACHVAYEKEFGNKKDSEAIQGAEARINKRIKAVIESLASIKNRLQEHENKNGDLEKRIEILEEEIKKMRNEVDAMTAENVKKIKETIKGQLKK
jgi:septal ring factor EnvC (AmiA/AmiB activator)